MNHLIKVKKADGTTELFQEEKLVNSLRKVGANKELIENVIDSLEKEMWAGMPTALIYKRAFELLKKHSAPVAVRYSIRRAMFELGPDGFPFEKFIARIFEAWGYEAKTDQMVMGSCVEHEVDVVAWKGDDLSMAEVKFHNDFGMRSDLKVALYVKARFDDIGDTILDYGDKKRKLTSKYLFTNTKFTETAILYGKCQNMQMISWNYPNDKSLHRIIEDMGLFPVTCITSLNHEQKRNLINLGILTCKDLLKSASVLAGAHVEEHMRPVVLSEAQMIMEIPR
jgi:hypothetical protein